MKDDLRAVFDNLIEKGAEDFNDGDMARIYIEHPDLHKPIMVPPRPLEEMNADVVMEAVENVLQSQEELNVVEGFDVQLAVARVERGGANGRPITNVQKDRITKRSIVSIKNSDNMCLAYALAVGVTKLCADEATSNKDSLVRTYQQVRKGHQGRGRSAQKRKASLYHELSGVQSDKQCSLLDIPMFEAILDISVVVFAGHLHNSIIYPDNGRPAKQRCVFLYYNKNANGEGHFDCIINIKGFFSKKLFLFQVFQGV